MRLTKSAYARHRGVSHTAVGKAVNDQRISIGSDGLIDPEVADREWDAAQSLRGGKRKAGKAAGSGSEPLKPVTQDAVDAVDEAAREAGHEPSEDGGPVTLTRARIANEVLRAKRQKLAYEVERGNLVDRRAIEAAVFNLARQEREAWMNFSARESARLAAALGVSEAEMFRELERAVRDYLAILAEIKLEI